MEQQHIYTKIIIGLIYIIHVDKINMYLYLRINLECDMVTIAYQDW